MILHTLYITYSAPACIVFSVLRHSASSSVQCEVGAVSLCSMEWMQVCAVDAVSASSFQCLRIGTALLIRCKPQFIIDCDQFIEIFFPVDLHHYLGF